MGKHNHPRGFLSGQGLVDGFYGVKKKLGRVPPIRKWYAGVRAIRNGRYKDHIGNYDGFLKDIGEVLPETYPLYPREAYEAALCECMEDLKWKRLPLRKEFEEKFPKLLNTLKRGRLKVVKNYGQMVEWITGIPPSYRDRDYWSNHPERVREAYYNDKEKYGEVGYNGFSKRNPGAWDCIQSGNYDPHVRNLNQFKRSLGESIRERQPNLSLEIAIQKYENCKSQLRRDLKNHEFEKMCGRAAKWISREIGWEKFMKYQQKKDIAWTKQDFIEAYLFLETRDNQKPSKRKFMCFYGSEQFKNNEDGIKNWNDLEKIVDEINWKNLEW